MPRIVAPLLVGAAVFGGAAFALFAVHPKPPATGLGAIHVPPGFKVEKVAGNDLVSYPMMGTVDDRGRLFLCESSGNTLDNKQMSSHPDYKIRMLEDRDGDGVYDHGTVFADKLTLPAGAVWYNGSLYVAAPPDLIRFKDTDGDGVADEKEVIVTGWTMSSNAASLHGPFFGPDGYLYLTDGRHGFNIHTRDDRTFKGMASRIWRVRPDGTGMEWLAGGGFDNPVEVVFTPAGETIGTMTYFKDPANGERDALLHYVEGGVYPKWYNVVSEFKRTGDLMPVMTKFARIAPAGLVRYRGAAFGREYEGNLFSAQFNPHRVQRHVLTREGSSFHTQDSDFLTSSDPDFHPTDVFEDSDGSLLVLDTGAWFIHGCPISRVAKPEIKGAIYRIRRTAAPRAADPRGEKLDMPHMQPEALAALLDDRRPFVRDRAVELLVAAGGAAVSPLAALRGRSRGYEARAAAVFALFRIGTPEALAAVRAALDDADFRVRTAAARCAGMARDGEAAERLMAMTRSDQPAPRRQAAAALGQIGDARAVAALLAASANAEDRYVEHSLIYSLISLNRPEPVEKALGAPQSGIRKAALIALDQMDGEPLHREQVAPFLAASDPQLRSAALWVVSHHPDWAGVVLAYLNGRLHAPVLNEQESAAVHDALLTFAANPEAQKLVADTLGDNTVSERRRLFLLDTMDAAPLKELPEAWVNRLPELLESRDANVRMRAVELIRSRNVPGMDPALTRIADDARAPDPLRAVALSVIVSHNPKLTPAQFAFLSSRLASQSDAVLRQTVARALARSTPDRGQLLQLAGKQLVHADPLVLSTALDCFRSSGDEQVGDAMLALLAKSPAALGTLGEEHLKALVASYSARVQERSKPLFQQLRDAQRERADRLRRLEPLLTAGGDVGRGRRIFFGEKVACSSCHTIGREGGQVGPDLTGIGAIRSGHDLLEAIVYPSASFVPGHEVYNVDIGNDRIAGVIRSQGRDALVLVTGPNGEIRIPRSKIRSIQRSNVSLMPEGFDEILSKTELTDLLAFLQNEKTRPRAD